MQASQVGRDAALALPTKVSPVKSTLHYDTTSKNSIDGESPSIILCFSDSREFVLYPMFFAYEDREQIIEVLIETFKCLAVATSIYKEEEVKVITLWECMQGIIQKKSASGSRTLPCLVTFI